MNVALGTMPLEGDTFKPASRVPDGFCVVLGGQWGDEGKGTPRASQPTPRDSTGGGRSGVSQCFDNFRYQKQCIIHSEEPPSRQTSARHSPRHSLLSRPIPWTSGWRGKLVDILAQSCDVVARFNGGNNAGHSLKACAERTAVSVGGRIQKRKARSAVLPPNFPNSAP